MRIAAYQVVAAPQHPEARAETRLEPTRAKGAKIVGAVAGGLLLLVALAIGWLVHALR